ncbi:MAG TPA: DUF559 domain-containing protein [Rhizomicrobium sp.]|jgi:very-short-patch-repair endonuclease|nr:DUF559 domain-containing protein [Rhizomicrobium sp.]
MQRKKSFRSGSNDVESRLWAKLQDLNESGYQFRKGQRYRSFMLDFVEHETLLVIDLDGGSAGRPQQQNVTRDRLLHEEGYTILRFWKDEASTDLDGVIASIRQVLDDRAK